MLVRVIIVSGLSPPLSWFLLLISMKGISSHSEVLSANRWLLPFPFSTSKRSSAPLYSAFEMFIKPLLFLPLYCHCAGLAHKGYCNGSLNFFPLVLFFLSKNKKREREPAAEIKLSWSNRNLCKCPLVLEDEICSFARGWKKEKWTSLPTFVPSSGHSFPCSPHQDPIKWRWLSPIWWWRNKDSEHRQSFGQFPSDKAGVHTQPSLTWKYLFVGNKRTWGEKKIVKWRIGPVG